MQLPQIEVIGIYHSLKVGPNNKITKNRKTTMFEIELPMEPGGISYIGSDFMPITTNLVICAKPGQVRHTKFPFKCYYIHMTLSQGYLYDTLMHMPDFLITKHPEVYREIFAKLCKYYDTRTRRDEIIQQSLVLELIHTLSRDAEQQTRQTAAKAGFSFIEESLAYIKENLTEDLSLGEMARRASVSPIYFHNCFKSAVGMTLREYVEEQRIKKSIHLLLTTDHSLTTIAFECGFSSQSYFSYVFKRKMKTTPRQYIEGLYQKYEQ